MMKVAIIGASKGLGYCLVKLFLESGQKVAAGVTNLARLGNLDGLLDKYPKNLMIFKCDVREENDIISAAQSCKKYLGEIDATCYVAGIIRANDRNYKIHESTTEDMRATFDVNFFGAYQAMREFYKVVKKNSSFFLVTSESCYTKSCGTWVPCYGLSKTVETKLSGMFNVAVDDVDFYSVHPGRMNTDMGKTTAQIEPEETAKGIYNLMIGNTKISRDKWYIDYNGLEI